MNIIDIQLVTSVFLENYKVLTIVWNTEENTMCTNIGENVDQFEAMAMLEYAMGEVEYLIEEGGSNEQTPSM